MLTANRLGDGIVVFLDLRATGSSGWWKPAVARSPDEVRALEARGAYDAARNLVVEPYLVEVREAADGLTPIRTRERVRVAGPSILDDVPGYVSPSLHRPSRWEDGRAEGRPHSRPEQASAPHPTPRLTLPQAGRGRS